MPARARGGLASLKPRYGTFRARDAYPHCEEQTARANAKRQAGERKRVRTNIENRRQISGTMQTFSWAVV